MKLMLTRTKLHELAPTAQQELESKLRRAKSTPAMSGWQLCDAPVFSVNYATKVLHTETPTADKVVVTCISCSRCRVAVISPEEDAALRVYVIKQLFRERKMRSFVNSEGRTVYAHSDATIEELLASGVRDLHLIPSGTPPKDELTYQHYPNREPVLTSKEVQQRVMSLTQRLSAVETEPDKHCLYIKGNHDEWVGPVCISSKVTASGFDVSAAMLKATFDEALEEADSKWQSNHQKRGPYTTKRKRR